MMKSFKCLVTCSTLAFFSLCSSNVFGSPYTWEVVRVTDGDTIVVKAPWILPELGTTISIRVYGIDTPEKGKLAKCAREAQLADLASGYTKGLIRVGDTVDVTNIRRDKYFRLLGSVSVDGKDLGAALIDAGFARPYYGKTKSNWCR